LRVTNEIGRLETPVLIATDQLKQI